MTSPSCGRIIIATVPDPQGRNAKQRPLVIVSPDEAIQRNEPLVAVAISTSYDQLDPAEYVILPWHPQGNTRTKLKARCAAVCTWLVEITATDITKFGGLVPPSQLSEILEKVSKLAKDNIP